MSIGTIKIHPYDMGLLLDRPDVLDLFKIDGSPWGIKGEVSVINGVIYEQTVEINPSKEGLKRFKRIKNGKK